MNKVEKIIIVVGLVLVIGVLLYPPVKLDGYSSTFAQLNEYADKYNVVLMPKGDYGESDYGNVNWTDTRRRFFFQNSSFTEDITITAVPENVSEDNPAEEMDGAIKWDGEIYIGRLLIEVFLISILTVAGIFIIRYNKE